jgi:hypothetical protein
MEFTKVDLLRAQRSAQLFGHESFGLRHGCAAGCRLAGSTVTVD